MLQFISQSPTGGGPPAGYETIRLASDVSFAHGVGLHHSRSASAVELGNDQRAQQTLPIEIGFLLEHGLSMDVLQLAAVKAKRCGVSAEQILLAEGKIAQHTYYEALGQSIGVAFAGEDLKLTDQAQYPQSLLSGLCPAKDKTGLSFWLIAPRGQQIIDTILLARQNQLPRDHLRLITPSDLQELVMASQSKEIAKQAVSALSDHDLDWSAHTPANRLQKLFLVVSLLGLLMGSLWLGNLVTFLGACLGLSLLASSLLRLFALMSELEDLPLHPATPLPEHRLPIYTILVPLYREASVVEALLTALDKIDYPAARLDIKLIVEEDDVETWMALKSRQLAAKYQIIRAPQGEPRTKPRALNIALPLARGSLITVYDAEDRPDPWQLRQAAALFASLPRRVACVQACLVIDNCADSWLARLFAIEYAALFDVFLPGLARLGVPLPLGGTSNHFRIEALRAVAGWDAWNVTEDIDLGLRLARAGYGMAHLPSTTDEEAPAQVSAWLRQRRRWLKGWIQTLITHLRDPIRLQHELGTASMLAVLALLPGGILGPLFGLAFGFIALQDALEGSLLSPQSWPEIALSTLWVFTACVGLVAILAPIILGMKRRGLGADFAVLGLLPVYFLLQSYAAWMALFESVRSPYSWAKTQHGLARTSRRQILNGNVAVMIPQARRRFALWRQS